MAETEAKKSKSEGGSRSGNRRRSGGKGRQRRSKKGTLGKISYHFAKRDFVCQNPECKGRFRISLGLIGALEMLRHKVKNRVNIVKGWVCPDCSQTGFKKDYHSTGVAADVTVNDVLPKDVFLMAESIPEIKGLGLNLDESYVHIDTRKADERLMWVVDGGQRTDITDSNRHKYFEPAEASES